MRSEGLGNILDLGPIDSRSSNTTNNDDRLNSDDKYDHKDNNNNTVAVTAVTTASNSLSSEINKTDNKNKDLGSDSRSVVPVPRGAYRKIIVSTTPAHICVCVFVCLSVCLSVCCPLHEISPN